MGNTTILNLPYPEPTARFRLGYAQIQALAEGVDTARLPYLALNNGSATVGIGNNLWVMQSLPVSEGSRGNTVVPYGSSLGIRVNRAGRYLIAGGAQLAGNATGSRGGGFTTDIDGARAVHQRRTMIPANPAGTATPVSFAVPIGISAGQGIGLVLFQNSGASLNATDLYLSVTEIG